ncbi:beta-1,3-1,4-glucanase [Phascolomyces articulosus]|uniref:Beta-1,3-1,4-glucanase n=1 Tax=Phascolomyces articulosus TaxID=60185 RepID=A0AAD5K6N3_9FUNG|nr:beta-1,3-1,4-glucanase [Phascolomyces articulosus]
MTAKYVTFESKKPSSLWQLQDTYQGSSFFNGFEFFHDPDPTHGFVNYVDQRTAIDKNLIQIQQETNDVLIKVDNHTVITPQDPIQGRNSVRISSLTTFEDNGLFLFDIEHMPTGCGTWPALWLLGPDWPHGGEVDIIEGVNLQSDNIMTLHTTTGCKQPPYVQQTGHTLTDNCAIDAPNQGANQGCSVEDDGPSPSFGAGFNLNGGGVFAVQWTPENGFQLWFFGRDSIPHDIQLSLLQETHLPNPNEWGTPTAQFPFDPNYCSPRFFKQLKIILNTTFCGDWAGNPVIYKNSTCPGKDCTDFVRNNPEKFSEAYWKIRGMKVYTKQQEEEYDSF